MIRYVISVICIQGVFLKKKYTYFFLEEFIMSKMHTLAFQIDDDMYVAIKGHGTPPAFPPQSRPFRREGSA